MTVDTEKLKELTDEQKDARFHELNKKSERTAEEAEELKTLKEDYGQRVQKRINKLNSEKEQEREAREKAEKRAAELEEKLKAKNDEPIQPRVQLREDVVEINGKKFYTDEALMLMIEAGKISEQDAIKHQRQREREDIKLDVLNELDTRKKQESEAEIRKHDAQAVLEKYPHFSNTHPKFNPEDPLYKLATELYNDGYKFNPNGLTKAVEQAEKFLKRQNISIDSSEDLSLASDDVFNKGQERVKEVVLTKEEKDIALRQWRDQKNPATGRNYTELEIIEKAKKAKTARRVV